MHTHPDIQPIVINGRAVGPGHPCLIIAEAGVNHNGDLDTAFRLVDAAIASGADVVKFQTFQTASLVTPTAAKADYQQQATGADESQYAMLKRLELPFDAFRQLMRYCRRKRILFLSTPFDEESADFLDRLGVAAFKIPSGELTNLPFLKRVAGYRKPMIVSTGMASLAEVNTAVRTIRETGPAALALLHCVSSYPADPATVNLRAMQTMATAFRVPIGFSDHTAGLEIAAAAVALGACIVEKHFTLDRRQVGPDHQASIEPHELAALVRTLRNVERALGDGHKRPELCETSVSRAARKSLVAARDLPAGTLLEECHLVVRRPGTGLSPALLPKVCGRVLRVAVAQGTPLTADMLAADASETSADSATAWEAVAAVHPADAVCGVS